MRGPSLEALAELDDALPPCLSLYQPTHRHFPDNKQDPIRFRNLVKELEVSLSQKHPGSEVRTVLEKFEALAEDQAFWKHTLDGLAVLGSAEKFEVFLLQRSVPELAIVANSFHTKPIRRFLQSTGRYQVLGLSLDRIQLFEGNRDVLDEIETMPDVPRTLVDALGDELTDPHLTVASYGGTGQGLSAMHHAHGSKTDEVDKDAERFFRAVDRGILEFHSRPSKLPLILAALPQHHHRFREVSHNPFLAEEAINFNAAVLSPDDLRKSAWRAAESHYATHMKKLASEFSQAQANGLGSSELTEVAEAAATGRVASLLIEADRQISGRLDPNTGKVEIDELADPEVNDLLDDLGSLVLKMGGEVVVMMAEFMPTKTGLAATYRY